MRPVDKGNTPLDPNDQQIVFTHYSDAKGYLIHRMGQYCSYCERRIPASLAVEHKQPKSLQPALSKTWSNLLLACVNCNSAKKDRDINNGNIDDYLWPDTDNTFLAISYSQNGHTSPNLKLPKHLQKKAQNSIDLFGLNKTQADDSKATDGRWIGRFDAWGIAQDSKLALSSNDKDQMRRQIVKTALGYGHFSIWMSVFCDDPDMRSRFIEAFPGTCKSCFEPSQGYQAINRPGGQC